MKPGHSKLLYSACWYCNQYNTKRGSRQDERRKAEKFIEKLTESKKYSKPIVTELAPLEKFYPAEEEHENFYLRHPEEMYSEIVMKLRAAELRGILRNSSVAEYPPSLACGELRKGYSPRLHPRSPAFVAEATSAE